MSVKWIKIGTQMFEDEKIRLIESMPEADTILIVWIKLLVQAGKSNASGYIYLTENIPFTEEMLSTIFNRPINTIRLALRTLEDFGMIEINEDDVIGITNWEKHQNVDGMERVKVLNAERNRRYRERKKRESLPNDVGVTSRDGTEEELELDIERDKDIKDIVGNEFPHDSYSSILTRHLIDHMLRNNPKAKIPKNGGKWLDAMEKIHRIDGYEINEIRAAIDFSQTDQFWRSNVLSPSKLREKMPTLILQMQRKPAGNQKSAYERQKDELKELYQEAINE